MSESQHTNTIQLALVKQVQLIMYQDGDRVLDIRRNGKSRQLHNPPDRLVNAISLAIFHDILEANRYQSESPNILIDMRPVPSPWIVGWCASYWRKGAFDYGLPVPEARLRS